MSNFKFMIKFLWLTSLWTARWDTPVQWPELDAILTTFTEAVFRGGRYSPEGGGFLIRSSFSDDEDNKGSDEEDKDKPSLATADDAQNPKVKTNSKLFNMYYTFLKLLSFDSIPF